MLNSKFGIEPIGDTFIRSKQEKNACDTTTVDELCEQVMVNVKVTDPISEQDLPQGQLLTVLNDDCLRHIFRQFSCLVDFCSIANVCLKFNEIAREVFSLKIKKKKIRFCDLDVVWKGCITLPQIKYFFENFAASVTWIEYDSDYVIYFLVDSLNGNDDIFKMKPLRFHIKVSFQPALNYSLCL